MGGPGSGPKKGQRRNKNKTMAESAGYVDEYVPRVFPRDIIDDIGEFDDPDRDKMGSSGGDRKYTKELVTAILDAILNGVHVRTTTDALGIHERTYYRWIEQKEDFKTLTRMAKARDLAEAMKMLTRLGAQSQNPNVLAIIAKLNNSAREYDWGKQDGKIDMTVRIEGAVDVNHILRDPKLIELENELEARRQQIEDGIIEGDYKELPPHEEQAS